MLHLVSADFNRTGLGAGGITVTIRIEGCTSLEVEPACSAAVWTEMLTSMALEPETSAVHAGVGGVLVIEVVIEGVVEAPLRSL